VTRWVNEFAFTDSKIFAASRLRPLALRPASSASALNPTSVF
jgi:hypothetical protein